MPDNCDRYRNGDWETPEPPHPCSLWFSVRIVPGGYDARLCFDDGFTFVGSGPSPLLAMHDSYRMLLQLHAQRAAKGIIDTAIQVSRDA